METCTHADVQVQRRLSAQNGNNMYTSDPYISFVVLGNTRLGMRITTPTHLGISRYTLVYRARPIFCATGRNYPREAKEGLAEVINIHN